VDLQTIIDRLKDIEKDIVDYGVEKYSAGFDAGYALGFDDLRVKNGYYWDKDNLRWAKKTEDET